MSLVDNHTLLKANTIHVHGSFYSDRNGGRLEKYLNESMKSCEHHASHGKVLSVVKVPNYTKKLELEIQIYQLEDLKMWIQKDSDKNDYASVYMHETKAEKPMLSCFFPSESKIDA
jgi:hypothetical protein